MGVVWIDKNARRGASLPRLARPGVVPGPTFSAVLYMHTDRSLAALRRVNDKTRRALSLEASASGPDKTGA